MSSTKSSTLSTGQNPEVQQLAAAGRLMGAGIFTNVSTSPSKELVNQEQQVLIQESNV